MKITTLLTILLIVVGIICFVSAEEGSENIDPTLKDSCGELIYFCSLDSPYCNLTNPVIREFINSPTCVHVSNNIIDSFRNLPENEVALKYKIDHVPTFVFIDEDGCFGEIGKTGNTKLEDIEEGIANFECNSSISSNSSTQDDNPCLEDSDNYFDQEDNECRSGFSQELIKRSCSDPDGGVNKYETAHTFGFRSNFANSKDMRIRTGGLVGCASNTQLVEHYCDQSGYIKTAYLNCVNGCANGSCIKGEEISKEIKCIFKGSNSEEKCYVDEEFKDEDETEKWCSGIGECSVNYTAERGEEVTWKSSCGGYKTILQDGNKEEIFFDCAPGKTNVTIIQENYFKNAYWKCSDLRESNEGGETSCKSYSIWKEYALSFCNNSEVKEFSLNNPCYPEFEKKIVYTSGASERDCEEYFKECKDGDENLCNKWETNCQKNITEEKIFPLICKDSCPFSSKCYPFGYRKGENYCSDVGSFVNQLEENGSCENNFECSSNLCIDSQCVSSGLFQKFLNWISGFFG